MGSWKARRWRLKTVQNHVSRILDKLQAADRTQAALRAREAGHRPQSRA